MKKSHAHIVSHTEKRTRIRVVPGHRNATDMEKFVAAVRTLPSVDKVRINVRSGSILIDHKGGTRDQFKGVFKDIGCILRSTLFAELPTVKGKLDLPQAIADLDFRLGVLGSPFRLGILIPLSLGALAYIQMRRQGIQFTSAPWYVLAYLAYYAYTKLNEFDKVIDKVTENSNR